MYLKSNLLYLHVETPLHVGAGSGLGAIDLPIQRERSTGYPLIQASGIKGAFRDHVATEPSLILEAVFGPDLGDNGTKAHAGSFSPGDAQILLFPVRSLKGVFAWTTSVNVLRRWERDSSGVLGLGDLLDRLGELDSSEDNEKCFTSSNNIVTSNGSVVLEEFAFPRQENGVVREVAEKLAEKVFSPKLDSFWKRLLITNLVVLPDDAFKDFVTYSTEVITRTRLETDSKTVVRGALWTEEHVPVDTIFYLPIRSTRIRMNAQDIPAEFQGTSEEQAQKVLKWLQEHLGNKIQLGGNETVGHGLVNLNWEIQEE